MDGLIEECEGPREDGPAFIFSENQFKYPRYFPAYFVFLHENVIDTDPEGSVSIDVPPPSGPVNEVSELTPEDEP